VFGRRSGWGFRRHHWVSAGFLASAIGMYSFAARLGLAPADMSSAVRWVTNSSGPLVAGTPLGAGGTEAIPPGVGGYSYAAPGGGAGGGGAANYQNIGYPTASYAAGDIACYFSPSGGCTAAVVNEIRQARQQILLQAYSFTSAPIATALVEAHQRGVAVYIILDKSQRTERYSSADFVAHAGIPTLIDAAHAIAHNKIMLIDGLTIITGSFNFTTNAEQNNAENLLIIRNRPDLIQAYTENFRRHYEHSQPYQGRGLSNMQPGGFNSQQPGGFSSQQPGVFNGQQPISGVIASEAARFLNEAEAEVARNLAEQWAQQQGQGGGPAGYPAGTYSR